MNIEGGCNTKIELALSVTSGSASNSSLAPPTRPTDTLTPSDYNITLGSRYGIDPALNDGSWTGFVGNAYVTDLVLGGTNTYRTQYPESFTVDTPAINTIYTDAVELTGSASYTVAIVDDDLTVVL